MLILYMEKKTYYLTSKDLHKLTENLLFDILMNLNVNDLKCIFKNEVSPLPPPPPLGYQ